MNKTIDEGYLKFNCSWTKRSLSISIPNEIKYWRDKMYRLKLIGHDDEHDVGYGNISTIVGDKMLVSGTQTGKIYPIDDRHFTLVDDYEIEKNWLHCIGEIKASSESLTHLAIYEADDSIKAVIHIHDRFLWDKLMDKVPTTNRNVAYGTPDMALEIKRLFAQSNVIGERIIVMGGHQDGIITFGSNLEQAGEIILAYL